MLWVGFNSTFGDKINFCNVNFFNKIITKLIAMKIENHVDRSAKQHEYFNGWNYKFKIVCLINYDPKNLNKKKSTSKSLMLPPKSSSNRMPSAKPDHCCQNQSSSSPSSLVRRLWSSNCCRFCLRLRCLRLGFISIFSARFRLRFVSNTHGSALLMMMMPMVMICCCWCCCWWWWLWF